MEMFDTFHLLTSSLKEVFHDSNLFELWSYNGNADWQPGSIGTHFGAVSRGTLTIRCKLGEFCLGEGMVFCVPGQMYLNGSGSAFGICARQYHGLFQIAGPVEEVGRLRYIDGCTDSLVIAPQVKGEPCLNHLHFPPKTDQTKHTHPSFRAGLVLRGHGTCKLLDGEVPLSPGTVFYLPPELVHGFRTNVQSMDVIAFHPDSDYGPEHDDHPMINRTIVDGVVANTISHIRT